ncbi:hypothetical protein KZ779_16180 [Escherichia coli]|nr:hypothetical protein [Escherichia coli]
MKKAYDLLTLAQGEFQADTAVAGLQAAYARDENDEFVKATVIRAEGQPDAAMEDGDALIFMNFRADRAREITRAFVNADFDGFARKKVVNVDFVMLTEYAADIKTAVAYPPASLVNTFGEWMAKNDKTQLRISETEKICPRYFLLQRWRRRVVQRRRSHSDQLTESGYLRSATGNELRRADRKNWLRHSSRAANTTPLSVTIRTATW